MGCLFSSKEKGDLTKTLLDMDSEIIYQVDNITVYKNGYITHKTKKFIDLESIVEYYLLSSNKNYLYIASGRYSTTIDLKYLTAKSVKRINGAVKWLNNKTIGVLFNSWLRRYNINFNIIDTTKIPKADGDFVFWNGYIIYTSGNSIYSFNYIKYDRSTENMLLELDYKPSSLEISDYELLILCKENMKGYVYDLSDVKLINDFFINI